jgi:glyoxylase-like metal-dependent hydrolase (beta-lactamase superfamily II)
MIDPNRLWRGMVNEIATDVWYVPTLMSNAYFVGRRGEAWSLIDTGTPGSVLRIRAAAREIFGNRRPDAIILTHGHFDHVGSLRELADEWDVPVFAHLMEFPYLDGRDNYPPPDPTVGGFMAQLSRFFPKSGVDVSHRLRALPMDNSVPFLGGWRMVYTPGHTAGHVSFFRDDDRTLIAGDAVISLDQQNPAKLLAEIREIHGPPVYFTPDWGEAHSSIRKLAQLRPRTLATGHGLPMLGEDVPDLLQHLADHFEPPRHGRYVTEPARMDEQGVRYLPPAPPDRVPLYAAGIAIAAAGILLTSSRRARPHEISYESTELLPYMSRAEISEPAAIAPGEAIPRHRMVYDIFGRRP